MTHPIAPHPDWQALLAASDADEAMQELHDRLDRRAEHGPAPICAGISSPAQCPTVPTGRAPSLSAAERLATGRSAVTGTPFHHDDAAAACQRRAA